MTIHLSLNFSMLSHPDTRNALFAGSNLPAAANRSAHGELRTSWPATRLALVLGVLTLLWASSGCAVTKSMQIVPPILTLPEEKVVGDKPDVTPDPITYTHFLMGLAQEEAGDTDKAIAHFRGVVERSPDAGEARRHLFRLLLERGDTGAAFALLDHADELQVFNPDQLVLFGRLFAWQRLPEKLNLVLQAMLQAAPDSVSVAELKGYQLLLSESLTHTVLQQAEKLFATATADPWASYFRGRVLEALGDLKGALSVYEKGIAVQPEFSLFVWHKCVVLEHLRRSQPALDCYASLEGTAPHGGDALTRRVQLVLGANVPAPALIELQNIFPGGPDDLAQQAFAAYGLREPVFAGNLLHIAINTDPEQPLANMFLGMIARQQNNAEGARQHFERVVKGSGAFVSDTLRELAALYVDNLDGRGAITSFQKMITAGTAVQWQIKLLARLGSHYLGQGTMLTYFGALTPTTELSEIYYQYMIGLEAAGRSTEAVLAGQQLLQRWPDHADALNYIGYTLADNNRRLLDAERMLYKAMELQPWSTYIMDSLAWVLYRLRRFNEAEEWIKMAAQYATPDPLIFDHYGDIVLARHQPEVALDLYRKALRLEPDAELRRSLEQKIGQLERTYP